MKTKLIETTQNAESGFNWGKFLVGEFDTEWEHLSMIADKLLLPACGWAPWHILVVDLQTGEGAIFSPGGRAKADLDKHKVWVCPMFEPFLIWLYEQDLTNISDLPDLVELPDAPAEMHGYRRPGR